MKKIKSKEKVTNKAADIFYIVREKDSELDDELKASVLFDSKEDGDDLVEIYIKHPYSSSELELIYDNDKFLEFAKAVLEHNKTDELFRPNVCVIEKDGEIIAFEENGAYYHRVNGCDRKKLGIVSGEYEKCEGCKSETHGEARTVDWALDNSKEDQLPGSTLHIYGHWWCCEPCSTKMEKAGIKKVVISKDWTRKFLDIKDL